MPVHRLYECPVSSESRLCYGRNCLSVTVLNDTRLSMLQIGKMNNLKIVKEVDFGIFLDGFDSGDILLPTRYLPETDFQVGDSLDVFICYDSDDRLIATTEKPLAMIGEIQVLRVVAVESIGVFLDWGLPKDLFLPHAEQISPLRTGQEAIVCLYLDNTNRICASMRTEKHMPKIPADYKEGQSVDLLIAGKSDLGYKALINGQHWGILYQNEVFQTLRYGQRTKGFIHNVREDGKIDLNLQKTGHKAADDIAPKILELLDKAGGFLAVTDKTAPEKIYAMFGVSKKKYKIALGGLYKQRLITVEDTGIRLVAKPAASAKS